MPMTSSPQSTNGRGERLSRASPTGYKNLGEGKGAFRRRGRFAGERFGRAGLVRTMAAPQGDVPLFYKPVKKFTSVAAPRPKGSDGGVPVAPQAAQDDLPLPPPPPASSSSDDTTLFPPPPDPVPFPLPPPLDDQDLPLPPLLLHSNP
uniref:ABI gene family member 3 n=1 Tax=Myxine glutinosa TaxID=7769 RepID=UPI00358E23FA